MGVLRHLLWAVVIWSVLAGVIIVLLDTPAWSAALFERTVNDEWVAIGVKLSTIIMLTLMGLYLTMLVRTWLTRSALPVVRLFLGGVIAVMIYNLNVVLKGNYQQSRPCHDVVIATECPPVDSFSYPSNHTVIAFGLAVGLAFALPRVAYLALPLAIIEGMARVIAGHHYPHDILAGASLGLLGVFGALVLTRRLQHGLAARVENARTSRRILTQNNVNKDNALHARGGATERHDLSDESCVK